MPQLSMLSEGRWVKSTTIGQMRGNDGYVIPGEQCETRNPGKSQAPTSEAMPPGFPLSEGMTIGSLA